MRAITRLHTNLVYASQADMCDPDDGIEAFDPFAPSSASDRRDLADYYASRLAWCPLADVARNLPSPTTALSTPCHPNILR